MDMTQRERFMAFTAFEPVDRIPRRVTFTDSLAEKMKVFLGASVNEKFVLDGWEGAGLRPPPGYIAPDFAVYHPGRRHGENGFTIDSLGVGHQGHGYYHFNEYISPLREARSFEDLTDYPIDDFEGWSDVLMREFGRVVQADDRVAGLMIGHMYENAWQIRGYEAFLMDLVTQRDWAEYLLDRFKIRNERMAVAAARAGYDLILTGDDVANQNTLMFRPELWREVFKPRWAAVYAAARSVKPDIRIWYHSDGNIIDIVDDLVEIGVNILNPVQPECMDPVALRKRYGRRLAFDGCVGTQTTFPFGTAEDMRRVVLGLAHGLDARQGGLMLSPTHVLEPEVPPENVAAFLAACDEAGVDAGGGQA